MCISHVCVCLHMFHVCITSHVWKSKVCGWRTCCFSYIMTHLITHHMTHHIYMTHHMCTQAMQHICVAWLLHMCDMTHAYDSYSNLYSNIQFIFMHTTHIQIQIQTFNSYSNIQLIFMHMIHMPTEWRPALVWISIVAQQRDWRPAKKNAQTICIFI